ncbi:MAG: hypothetical protein HQM09_16005 [Candidatus Riflebacteria bacterium]|nr:hypothetical protein [Candidatus Riflebacteria bacterium]
MEYSKNLPPFEDSNTPTIRVPVIIESGNNDLIGKVKLPTPVEFIGTDGDGTCFIPTVNDQLLDAQFPALS